MEQRKEMLIKNRIARIEKYAKRLIREENLVFDFESKEGEKTLTNIIRRLLESTPHRPKTNPIHDIKIIMEEINKSKGVF